MNIPNLPTDNLYKFMAMSGLFILIFSASYPIYRQFELKHRWDALTGEMKVLELEVDSYERLIKTKTYKFKPSEDIPKLLNHQKALANLQAQGKQLFTLQSEIRIYKWFCSVGIFCGTLLTFLGFYLWYFRVQRLQDLLLYREATIEKERNGRK